MTATAERVTALKEAGEDFEWYPTTDEILRKIACRIQSRVDRYYSTVKILDIGAGDGRALVRLEDMMRGEDGDRDRVRLDKFAIEKSMIHLANMPKEIVVIGTDFYEQTLVDKKFDAIFCNPPYSEYETWVHRILKECDAEHVYLVIPKRWRDNQRINQLVEDLGATVDSLGEFDFERAERQARAKVEIVHFTVRRREHSAFDAAIEDMLPELDRFDVEVEDMPTDEPWEKRIAEGGTVIDSLVAAYDTEQQELLDTYREVVKINPFLLKELGVTKANIMVGIREKIMSLKNRYWAVLFDHLKDITKRFATKQRKAFLDSLTSKTVIDFTHGNVRSMLIWISKWGSDYFDEQLVELFQAMATHANVENYKSNHKVYTEGRYRYQNEKHDHCKVEYRLVMEYMGGVHKGQYTKWDYPNGLAQRGHEFLEDFITVANNLGFACDDSSLNYQWESNSKVELFLNDGTLLMDVRAFKNGNMHIRVSKRVMLAINIQAGKLLGWLKNADDMYRELDIEPEDFEFAGKTFKISNRITANNLLKLENKAG